MATSGAGGAVELMESSLFPGSGHISYWALIQRVVPMLHSPHCSGGSPGVVMAYNSEAIRRPAGGLVCGIVRWIVI